MATHGLIGPLSAETFLLVLDNLDLAALVAAHDVCRTWRRFLQDTWRTRYLGMVDASVGWRLRALDGEVVECAGGEAAGSLARGIVELEDEVAQNGDEDEDDHDDALSVVSDAQELHITEDGDGRGVSGPPIESVLHARLALKSGWWPEFHDGVIAHLGPESALKTQLSESVGTPLRLPRAKDLVYQYGTRLDRPDWHGLCAAHVEAARNMANGHIVSTTIAPVYVPADWKYLRLDDDDPSDDALLLTAYRPGAEGERFEFVLITVERSSGEIRHITALPLPTGNDEGLDMPEPMNRSLLAFDAVGIAYNTLTRDDGWRTYVSGRAFNHLCPDVPATRPRDRHLQLLGDMDASFHNLDLGNFRNERGLTLSLFDFDTLAWERFTHRTLGKRKLDHSIPVKDAHGVSENYILLGWGQNQVRVYAKATGELLVTLPAGVSRDEARTNTGAEVAPFSFAAPEGLTKRRKADADFGDACAVRQFAMVASMPDDDEYWDAVKSNVWRGLTVVISSFAICGPHLLLTIARGGFLLMREFEEVFRRAAAIEPDARARFVTQYTVLIDPGADKNVPYACSETYLVWSKVRDKKTTTHVLDLAGLSPLDAEPTLKGHVILRRNTGTMRLLDLHVGGGRIYELVEYPWHFQLELGRNPAFREVFPPNWDNDPRVGKTALRITSYVPSSSGSNTS